MLYPDSAENVGHFLADEIMHAWILYTVSARFV